MAVSAVEYRGTADTPDRRPKRGDAFLVFISHNSADKDIAREIGVFLAAEGVDVWFDEWKVAAGDSITEAINSI